jgi:hypothetical protein
MFFLKEYLPLPLVDLLAPGEDIGDESQLLGQALEEGGRKKPSFSHASYTSFTMADGNSGHSLHSPSDRIEECASGYLYTWLHRRLLHDLDKPYDGDIISLFGAKRS